MAAECGELAHARGARLSPTGHTWAETTSNLGWLLGAHGEEEAVEWIRQAVRARWGVDSLRDLTRRQREQAHQKALTVWYRLADEHGDLAFTSRHREIVRETFAGVWDGAWLDGPAWRLDADETGRPTYEEHMAGLATAADFG